MTNAHKQKKKARETIEKYFGFRPATLTLHFWLSRATFSEFLAKSRVMPQIPPRPSPNPLLKFLIFRQCC